MSSNLNLAGSNSKKELRDYILIKVNWEIFDDDEKMKVKFSDQHVQDLAPVLRTIISKGGGSTFGSDTMSNWLYF